MQLNGGVMRIDIKVLVRLFLVVGTIASGPALSADTSTPLVGTWILNLTSSALGPPPPLKRQIMRILVEPGGGIHEIIDYQKANGIPIHIEFTTLFDGRESTVSGNGEADTIVASRLNTKTFRYVYKSAGRELATAVFTVSDDEKSLVGPVIGATGSWRYNFLFDRAREK
jgi:hypothetical protein